MSHDFKLGDIVTWNSDVNEGYTSCTVQSVNSDGTVDLFRPYTHHADFSCAGKNRGDISVLCYVGVEKIERVNPELLRLIYRSKYTNIR